MLLLLIQQHSRTSQFVLQILVLCLHLVLLLNSELDILVSLLKFGQTVVVLPLEEFRLVLVQCYFLILSMESTLQLHDGCLQYENLLVSLT